MYYIKCTCNKPCIPSNVYEHHRFSTDVEQLPVKPMSRGYLSIPVQVFLPLLCSSSWELCFGARGFFSLEWALFFSLEEQIWNWWLELGVSGLATRTVNTAYIEAPSASFLTHWKLNLCGWSLDLAVTLWVMVLDFACSSESITEAAGQLVLHFCSCQPSACEGTVRKALPSGMSWHCRVHALALPTEVSQKMSLVFDWTRVSSLACFSFFGCKMWKYLLGILSCL